MKYILLVLVVCLFGCKKTPPNEPTYDWGCAALIYTGSTLKYSVYGEDTFYNKTNSQIKAIEKDSTYYYYIDSPITHTIVSLTLQCSALY